MSTLVAGIGRAALVAPRAILRLPSVRLRRWAIAIAVALLALTAAYMLWFRHSSLVAVEELDIRGLSFAEPEVSAALQDAAAEMTTLNADAGELERALERFPTVAAVSIESDFPHRLVVEVSERSPVGTVAGIAVAGDGTVLEGVDAGGLGLPPLDAAEAPRGGHLGGTALAQAEILGAAPAPLRPAIRTSEVDPAHGITIGLEGKIDLRFGDSRDAAAKWAAAAAILADPKLEELSYIDLRLPGRAAVGGAPVPVSEEPEGEAALPAAPPAAAPAEPVAPVDPAADPAPVAPAPVAPEPEVVAPTPAPASGVAGAAVAP